MNRPHFLIIMMFAFLIVLVTFFLTPPFSFSDQEESDVVEHGWPIAWASTPSYTEIPIIGPLLFWMMPDTFTFLIQGFLFDVGFWFTILWLVVISTTKRSVETT